MPRDAPRNASRKGPYSHFPDHVIFNVKSGKMRTEEIRRWNCPPFRAKEPIFCRTCIFENCAQFHKIIPEFFKKNVYLFDSLWHRCFRTFSGQNSTGWWKKILFGYISEKRLFLAEKRVFRFFCLKLLYISCFFKLSSSP